MARIQVIRPCVIHAGPSEYAFEPGEYIVSHDIADKAIGHGLAIALPEFQDVPPAVETAPNTALDAAPTVTTELKPGRGRRKGQARRRG